MSVPSRVGGVSTIPPPTRAGSPATWQKPSRSFYLGRISSHRSWRFSVDQRRAKRAATPDFRRQWLGAGSAPASRSALMTPWMRGLVSAPDGMRLCTWLRSPGGSARFLDADQVAGGIAEGAVANAVRLVGRLLDDLGVAGLQPLEGGVEVGGGQVDAGEGALGHHFGDHAALVLGDAGRGGRRVHDDRRSGLGRRPDRNPVDALVLDV